MLKRSYTGCHVCYDPTRIILEGEPLAIHAEADKLVQQFRYSGHPLRVLTDRGYRMVLTYDE